MDAVKIGGQVLYVFAGGLFTFLIGLPLQIFVVRSLGAEQFGAYSIVEGALATISGFLSLGIAPTVVRFVPEHIARGESGHVRSLVVLASVALLTVGLAGASLTALGSREVIGWWGINPNTQNLIAVMVLTIPIGLLTFLYQQILRGFQEIFIMIFISSVVTLTAKAALSVVLIHSGWGTIGYAWAVVLSSGLGLTLLATAALSILCRLDAPGKQITRPTRLWIRYASVWYANGLFSTAFQYLDRFIIGALIGSEGVAALVIARQLQQLPQTLFNMFITVVGPMFAANRGPRLNSIYQLTTNWCMRLGLPLVFFLMVFASPILSWYGKSFPTGGTPRLVQLLLLSTLICMSFGPIGNLLMMAGCELKMFRVTIAQTAATIASYLIFIPLFGIIGLGFAVVISTILGNVWAFRIAKSQFGDIWSAPRYMSWVLAMALSLSSLVTLRALWSEDASAVWLMANLIIGYIAFFSGNFVSGFHSEDRELYSAVIARLKATARHG